MAVRAVSPVVAISDGRTARLLAAAARRGRRPTGAIRQIAFAAFRTDGPVEARPAFRISASRKALASTSIRRLHRGIQTAPQRVRRVISARRRDGVKTATLHVAVARTSLGPLTLIGLKAVVAASVPSHRPDRPPRRYTYPQGPV